MSLPSFDEIVVPNDQIAARQEHLARLAELVVNAYPSKFVRSSVSGREDTISGLKRYAPVADAANEMDAVRAALEPGERPPAEIKDKLNEALKALGVVRVAGRIATPIRGNFVHLTDGREKLQIYAKKGQFTLAKNDGQADLEADQAWEAWQILDHGDLIGVEGFLFVTNTGEVSVHVERLYFLSKALSPMPDKMHGIEDAEIKQRQRYLDLIASSLQIKSEPPVSAGGQELTTREVFERRAKIISSMRRFLEDHDYIEVETPMLTPKATGAAAKPFKTHHNALDIDLYARIAPELYLKRLVVGGFEKVYELNRNFRNEGISYKHNPEFTMLEFYCAYMDVNGMMDFCEKLIQESVRQATGGLTITYEGNEIDFSKFERVSMREAVSEPGAVATGFPEDGEEKNPVATAPGSDLSDAALLEAFEEKIEPNLIQPTFIVDFPKSISPLSKASPTNPQIAERFELFINGMEVANGFSELNDPREQYERFVDQAAERERGDDEAMVLDEDYVRALSYGMPPAAGIGIGIDRLVMLLTNKHSIRDVILFPHMRPERRADAVEAEDAE
ncbi:MAG: lysine--tRNA ligase [Pyrinomonadaceae bacterium]|nr:lysine--tRNA ligase [Pyrinomonadaceae bacterium]